MSSPATWKHVAQPHRTPALPPAFTALHYLIALFSHHSLLLTSHPPPPPHTHTKSTNPPPLIALCSYRDLLLSDNILFLLKRANASTALTYEERLVYGQVRPPGCPRPPRHPGTPNQRTHTHTHPHPISE